MTSTRYRVNSIALNLRSAPLVRPGNRIALLSQGNVVTKVGRTPDPRWWEVSVDMAPSRLQGFVAHAYLEPSDAFTEPTATQGITEVHLREDNRSSARDKVGGWAFPIGEAGRPPRQTKPRDAPKVIDWLRVERSARYQPGRGATYCNVYAYDYCYLSGVYLPRVWWTPRALADLAQGKEVKPFYGETVDELNANSLFAWLKDYGGQFGWARVYDLTELQEAANTGAVAVICAQRKERNQPGHIAAVAPETNTWQAVRSATAVTRPLQSQAGSTNYRYGTPPTAWWVDERFGPHGFWHNA